MPQLFIKCPSTGLPTPTGMDVPENMDKRNMRSNTTNCRHCNQLHTWDGVDAFFLGDKK